MIRICQKSNCCGCGTCVVACPKSCITFNTDEEGYSYPLIAEEQCVNCNKCVKVCPVINGTKLSQDRKVYACINKDEEIRLSSSSGGVFYSIAISVVKEGGVVYGAFVGENLCVRHTRVNTIEGLSQLQGSKYVQSDITSVLKLVTNDIKDNKTVMFVGTPCQVQAVYNYIGKHKPSNLILVDFVCHGVPSSGLWDSYIKYIESKTGRRVTNYSFRDKSEGWRDYSLRFKLDDGQIYKEKNADSPFLQSFIQSFILRPSCYSCKFKGVNRISDLTIADFWGVRSFFEDMDDNKGTSLVIANTINGRDIVESCNALYKKEMDDFAVLRSNYSYNLSSLKPFNRQSFFKTLFKEGWDSAMIYAINRKNSNIVRKIHKLYFKIKRNSFQ